MKPQEADFYENSEVAPATKNRSLEGAFKAIEDMKELIAEVEGADPRYEQLRQEARAAGKGYFEYAVGSSTNRGLTDLFNTLAAQPKAEEKSPEPDPENSDSEFSPENSESENSGSENLEEALKSDPVPDLDNPSIPDRIL